MKCSTILEALTFGYSSPSVVDSKPREDSIPWGILELLKPNCKVAKIGRKLTEADIGKDVIRVWPYESISRFEGTFDYIPRSTCYWNVEEVAQRVRQVSEKTFQCVHRDSLIVRLEKGDVRSRDIPVCKKEYEVLLEVAMLELTNDGNWLTVAEYLKTFKQ